MKNETMNLNSKADIFKWTLLSILKKKYFYITTLVFFGFYTICLILTSVLVSVNNPPEDIKKIYSLLPIFTYSIILIYLGIINALIFNDLFCDDFINGIYNLEIRLGKSKLKIILSRFFVISIITSFCILTSLLFYLFIISCSKGDKQYLLGVIFFGFFGAFIFDWIVKGILGLFAFLKNVKITIFIATFITFIAVVNPVVSLLYTTMAPNKFDDSDNTNSYDYMSLYISEKILSVLNNYPDGIVSDLFNSFEYLYSQIDANSTSNTLPDTEKSITEYIKLLLYTGIINQDDYEKMLKSSDNFDSICENRIASEFYTDVSSCQNGLPIDSINVNYITQSPIYQNFFNILDENKVYDDSDNSWTKSFIYQPDQTLNFDNEYNLYSKQLSVIGEHLPGRYSKAEWQELCNILELIYRNVYLIHDFSQTSVTTNLLSYLFDTSDYNKYDFEESKFLFDLNTTYLESIVNKTLLLLVPIVASSNQYFYSDLVNDNSLNTSEFNKTINELLNSFNKKLSINFIQFPPVMFYDLFYNSGVLKDDSELNGFNYLRDSEIVPFDRKVNLEYIKIEDDKQYKKYLYGAFNKTQPQEANFMISKISFSNKVYSPIATYFVSILLGISLTLLGIYLLGRKIIV